MLQPYLDSINSAVLWFPLAAALFTLPFLIVQFRRHGYINKWRGFVLYLFLLYLMCAYFLVLLPFPDSVHNESPGGSTVQPIPFRFVSDILRESAVVPGQPLTYIRIFTEFAFLQVAFNVLLTIPFGLFVRYYFRASALLCLLASFLLSAFFEITQLTGVFGIFDYPYRFFDVDDLIANTAGGMLGVLAAEWVSRRLPNMERLDDGVDLLGKRVSYSRRMLAFFIDYFIWNIPLNMLTGEREPPGLFAYWLVTGAYFILLPLWTKGFTPGKWLVRIRIVGSAGDTPSLRELAMRQGLLYGALGSLQLLPASAGSGIAAGVLALVVLILNAGFAIHLFLCVFKPGRPLFYEKLSGTKQRIADKKN
ncbi:VanZ family protein [Saccharibacillus deserti]|uniref:VanZ family protein n=1 Tax=Saccharibacillus deserti TaxID=1634444 RepID=UPI0015536AFE|nr:VanZ family protein [Saccharibacillus deserti]